MTRPRQAPAIALTIGGWCQPRAGEDLRAYRVAHRPRSRSASSLLQVRYKFDAFALSRASASQSPRFGLFYRCARASRRCKRRIFLPHARTFPPILHTLETDRPTVTRSDPPSAARRAPLVPKPCPTRTGKAPRRNGAFEGLRSWCVAASLILRKCALGNGLEQTNAVKRTRDPYVRNRIYGVASINQID